mmetsp:Transcript_8091/g.50041  ORF Transcript_8091/g.50041 Transcript_8091/m.50041 type:complete len:82 (+) Transcript_8091:3405-3650(+)
MHCSETNACSLSLASACIKLGLHPVGTRACQSKLGSHCTSANIQREDEPCTAIQGEGEVIPERTDWFPLVQILYAPWRRVL